MEMLKVPTKKESSGGVVALFSTLFHAITQTHILHLQTNSYAEHAALGSFYDGLDGFTDSLIETYQGKYGIVKGYKSLLFTSNNAAGFLKEFHSTLESSQTLFTDTDLKNIFDEIKALTKQTLYKVNNLS